VCDQEDVFLYNQMPADGRVLMISGHGPHPFEDASAEAFAERGLAWTP
jgi:hypothetical protein